MSFNVKVVSCQFQFAQKCNNKNLLLPTHSTQYPLLFLHSFPLFFPNCTMLQKLSKCEVKAWLCWSLIILLTLRFYVKSNLGEFKRCKYVILANLETLNFEFLVHLGLESCSNVLKSKLKTSKIAKNYIFDWFNWSNFDLT